MQAGSLRYCRRQPVNEVRRRCANISALGRVLRRFCHSIVLVPRYHSRSLDPGRTRNENDYENDQAACITCGCGLRPRYETSGPAPPAAGLDPIDKSSPAADHVVRNQSFSNHPKSHTHGQEKQRRPNDRRQETGRQSAGRQRAGRKAPRRSQDHENLTAPSCAFATEPEMILQEAAEDAEDAEELICPLITRICADGLPHDPRPSASSAENSGTAGGGALGHRANRQSRLLRCAQENIIFRYSSMVEPVGRKRIRWWVNTASQPIRPDSHSVLPIGCQNIFA